MEEERPFIEWVIEDLYKEEDLKEILAQYDIYFGTLKGKDFRESEIYKRYLSQFDTLPFGCHVASEYGDDDAFDWDLLYRLIFASISMEYYFEIRIQDSQPPVDLHILVKSSEDGQMIDRTLAELWLTQIIELYYIFLREQIELFVEGTAEEEEEDEEESTLSQLIRERITHFQRLKVKTLIELELYEHE